MKQKIKSMSTRDRLILGVILLWASSLLPMLVYVAPIQAFSRVFHSPKMDAFIGLLGIVGMALLMVPYYRGSNVLKRYYRQIDKAVSLLAFLMIIPGIMAMFFHLTDTFEPAPYVGFSLLLVYLRILVSIALFFLWGYALVCSKGRLALIAVLCFTAYTNLPHPRMNNQFTVTVLDEESRASRILSKEDADALLASDIGINDLELAPPDNNRTLFVSSSSTRMTNMPPQSYIVLLAAYTFMRFGRKEEEVVAEEPDESDDEPLRSAAVPD